MFFKFGGKKKSRDEVFVIEDLIRTKRYLTYFIFVLLLIGIINTFISVYFIYLKKDRVILLDINGKPQIGYTVDDRYFLHELQSFVNYVVVTVYERSYIEFLNEEERKKVINNIGKFFRSGDELRQFIEAYFNSQYIKGVVEGKQIVRVVDILPFEFMPAEEKGVTRAVGMIKIGVYQIQKEGNVLVQVGTTGKKVVIEFIKGTREISNPYGYYITRIYELSS